MNPHRIILTALILSLSVGLAFAGAGKPQTLCPVMNRKIDKSIYVDYQGQRIYFCCRGCVAAFKKNPEKYVKILKDQGVALEPVQTRCPVMGRKINKKFYADYKGRRVYFCCKGCIAAFKKNPEKYMKRLDARRSK